MKPLVSVVMPCFNVAPYIFDAVQSALAQTWGRIEVIVVDDGSTDGTVRKIYGIADSRLRVVVQDNAGSSAARNTGIASASGDFVAFLDGDDIWAPDKIEKHMTVLRHEPDVDLTFSWSRVVDEGGNNTGRNSRKVYGRIGFEHLLCENVINNGSAVVLRREALDRAGHFRSNLSACVDLDVWLRVALLRPRNIHCIPEYLTMYRMRPGQITKDWKRLDTAWNNMLEDFRILAPDAVGRVENCARGRHYRYLSYVAYQTRDMPVSRKFFRQAMALCWWDLIFDRRTLLLGVAICCRLLLPGSIGATIESRFEAFRARRAYLTKPAPGAGERIA